MSNEEGVKLSQIGEYQFGGIEVPEGFDPDARGYTEMPVGIHVVYVADAELFSRKEFNERVGGNPMTYILNQIRPRLCIASGPHAGATMIDFLPMPTPGLPIGRMSANRWANFIGAFGFRAPSGALVPPGFSLRSLLGSAESGPWAQVEVVFDVRNGQPQTRPDGTPQKKVKLFGYSHPATTATTAASALGMAPPLPAAPPSPMLPGMAGGSGVPSSKRSTDWPMGSSPPMSSSPPLAEDVDFAL